MNSSACTANSRPLDTIKLNLVCFDLASELSSGVVLTQLWRHYTDGLLPVPGADGWISQPRKDWAYESGITLHMLDRAVRLLVGAGRFGQPFVQKKIRLFNGAPVLNLRLDVPMFLVAYVWAKEHPLVLLPPRKPIDDKTRLVVFARDVFVCQACGAMEYLSVDHRIPRSKGGPDDLENYQTLCRKCNSKKGNKMPKEVTNA